MNENHLKCKFVAVSYCKTGASTQDTDRSAIANLSLYPTAKQVPQHKIPIGLQLQINTLVSRKQN
jgi:hypothetical protein